MNSERSSRYRFLMEQVVELGRIDEARRIVYLLGTKRLGDPLPCVREQIDKTIDLEELEAIIYRIESVQSWRELVN